jgi:hypothetical protein
MIRIRGKDNRSVIGGVSLSASVKKKRKGEATKMKNLTCGRVNMGKKRSCTRLVSTHQYNCCETYHFSISAKVSFTIDIIIIIIQKEI